MAFEGLIIKSSVRCFSTSSEEEEAAVFAFFDEDMGVRECYTLGCFAVCGVLSSQGKIARSKGRGL